MGWFDNAIGSIFSSAAGIFGANTNRQWQEHMASTAHQREVADLKKAGLNPLLSVMGGSGSAVPQGGYVVPENPLKTASQDQVSARRLNEIEKEQLKLQADATAADVAAKASQASLNRSNEEMNTYSKQKIMADVAYVNQLAMTEDSKRMVNSAVAARELAAAETQAKMGNYYDAQVILSGITGSREQQMIQTLKDQGYYAREQGHHTGALRQSELLRQAKLRNESEAQGGFLGRFVPHVNLLLDPVRKMLPFTGKD